jgi:hypothetical protein
MQGRVLPAQRKTGFLSLTVAGKQQFRIGNRVENVTFSAPGVMRWRLWDTAVAQNPKVPSVS